MMHRLDRILSLADPVSAMADIGTDHGFVPYAYLKEGLAGFVYAIDISGPSLDKARETLKPYKGHYRCLLGDGLSPLKPGQVQGLVLAGMGGRLIAKILEEGKEVAALADYILVQAMQAERPLLEFLKEMGYTLLDEGLAYERDKFYRIMKISKKLKGHDICLDQPRLLLERKDPLLTPYLNQKLERLEEVKVNLKKAKNFSESAHKWLEITKQEDQIRRWLDAYC